MLVEVLAVSGIANRSDTITATRQTVHAVFNFICADVGNDYTLPNTQDYRCSHCVHNASRPVNLESNCDCSLGQLQ